MKKIFLFFLLAGCSAPSLGEVRPALSSSEWIDSLPEIDDPGVVLLVSVEDFDGTPYTYWSDMLETSADTYMLAAGDYTGVQSAPWINGLGGQWAGATWISLRENVVGDASRRKVIRAAGEELPWERDLSEEVRVTGFHAGDIYGRPTHHWILSGLTMRGGTHQNAVWMGSHDVVVDRALIEGNDSPYGVRILLRAERVTVQNSMLRDPATYTDGVAIQLRSPSNGQTPGLMHDHRIIGNWIEDYNDGIGITVSNSTSEPDIFDGTVIADNDILVTQDLYTQGGAFARAENAIDVKGGASCSDSPVLVTGNRIRGYRYSAAGTSDGVAITSHFWSQNIHFIGNRIWDSSAGVRELQWPDGDVNRSRNNIYRANTFHDILPHAPQDTGYVWKFTVPAELEDNLVSHCGVLQGTPGVQVGSLSLNGNVALDCPLGEASTLWATGGNRSITL